MKSLLHFASDDVNDIQKDLLIQAAELGRLVHFSEVAGDEGEAVFLHGLHADGVCLLQHPHHVAHGGAVLQYGPAVVVELSVAKPVEVGCREYVQSILGWYLHVSIVDVPQEGVKSGPGGDQLPKGDLHLAVLGHEGAEEGLKVGAPGGQDGPVGEDHAVPYLEGHVREGLPHVAVEELVQVVLEGGDGDRLLLRVVGVGRVGPRPELLPAYDLHHEGLVKALEGRAHDHLAEVALPDDELEAVVLEAGQLELRGAPQDLQDAVHGHRGLDVLHAEELQTLGLQEDGQLVDVHHHHHLCHAHPLPGVVLQLRVDVVRVHEVQGHVERSGRHLLQVDLQRCRQDKGWRQRPPIDCASRRSVDLQDLPP